MNEDKKIFIAADHAGFELKENLKKHFYKLGFEVLDMGNEKLEPADDYPDFVVPLAKKVAESVGCFGIIIGGSGQGEAMAANKIKGIRAAVIYDEYSARMSRMDNDANIASFGARAIGTEDAKKLAELWIKTPFSGEDRHKRRIVKVDELA